MNKLKITLLACVFTFQINSNPLKTLKTATKHLGYATLYLSSLGGMAGTANNIGEAVVQYPFEKPEEKSKKQLFCKIAGNTVGFVLFGRVMLKSFSKFMR